MKTTNNPDWNGHINLKRYPVDHDRFQYIAILAPLNQACHASCIVMQRSLPVTNIYQQLSQ